MRIRRVRLVALKFLEWREIRVRISEADDEADHHLMIVEVIEERAAISVVWSGQPAV
ncbi:hypothetical protein NK8_84590 (plasmid) [Caballeronia sp. NK8]|nr:hypothetical protein NK8_84590 [Caballeronia sp. NK8]